MRNVEGKGVRCGGGVHLDDVMWRGGEAWRWKQGVFVGGGGW